MFTKFQIWKCLQISCERLDNYTTIEIAFKMTNTQKWHVCEILQNHGRLFKSNLMCLTYPWTYRHLIISINYRVQLLVWPSIILTITIRLFRFWKRNKLETYLSLTGYWLSELHYTHWHSLINSVCAILQSMTNTILNKFVVG